VQGVLLLPVGYRAGQKYPLLVEVHGGPTGSTSAGFKASASSPGQYWAGRGWAVLYPNPRGSTAYGQAFMRGNIPDWGGGDYRDIMAGVDELIRQGIADSARTAILGWSYGGYMTAWVVSQTARFKAARMGAGMSDVASMYGTTDIPGYIGLFFGGQPAAATRGLFLERSPLTHAHRVTTPLLILHGAADERVPPGQALRITGRWGTRARPCSLLYPRAGGRPARLLPFDRPDRRGTTGSRVTRSGVGDVGGSAGPARGDSAAERSRRGRAPDQGARAAGRAP
jgi:dipeptidyl aminopeptidase/acylaminoacyl peptidase